MSQQRSRPWTSTDIPPQTGRRVVITGANSGVGFEAALELARAGAEIVLPARTMDKASGAADRIRREVPRAKLTPAILDLASQTSVRQFAASLRPEDPNSHLDLLINNAGVMAVPQRELTPDGWERQFATNYLGPFALTGLLLPMLLRTSGSRMVFVASSAANMGKIRFDNLQSEQAYKPMWGAYAQSKLADLIFAKELQRKLAAAGAGTISLACHPGYSITNLQSTPEHNLMMKLLETILKPVLSMPASQGALPTLYAATSPDAQPGGYYGPDGPFELKGYPKAASVPKTAEDRATAERLWAESERLTGVRYSFR